ncbi:MAG: hypothetical protein WHS44_00180 [Fimbriimonadales bacterium]|nr:MAG: hypothetical protein KatS3mg018_0911 [Fimbriimonadales bacterium]
MSAERITRREMLKRLVIAPIGVAALAALEMQHAHAATMQLYYEPYFVAVLCEGRTRCDTLWRSMVGDTLPLVPTVQHTTPYDRLWWMGYALGSAPVDMNVRILARAVDRNGVPLGPGWRTLGQATLQTPPLRWFRVEIPEGHWDEYRIEVRSATPRLVYSRLIASQGYWKE